MSDELPTSEPEIPISVELPKTESVELPKTEKEKILQLKKKIFELREKRLLVIENLEKESNNYQKELDNIKAKLEKDEIDFKVAGALTKIIDSKKAILKECRLALSFLLKEEGRLEYELQKLGG